MHISCNPPSCITIAEVDGTDSKPGLTHFNHPKDGSTHHYAFTEYPGIIMGDNTAEG